MNFYNNSQKGYNTTWRNTGKGFANQWGGFMDYDASPTNFYFGGSSTGIVGGDGGGLPTINIPTVYLTGSTSGWGSQIQSQFNSHMNSWNVQGRFDWYAPAGQGNWFFGVGAALAGVKGGLNDERMYAQGIRGGLSGNYALTGRNLSLFGKMVPTKASMPISSVAKWGGIAGQASFGVGVALDGYAWYKGEISGAKFGLNTGIGAYGLTVAGAIPSILYFGVDAFYPGGWTGNADHPGVFNDQSQLNQENSFNPYWQIWPGAMKQ